MTAPHPHQPAAQHPEPQPDGPTPGYLRNVLWVAIGALIAAALVCVVWVLVGPDNGIIGRAFLTILLLAGFAGVAILDAGLAPRRPAWFALASMIVWVVTLLIGAFLIWMPTQRSYYYDSGFGRFIAFLLIVLVLQLGLLHVRLYLKAHARHVTGFTKGIAYATVGLVTVLAVLLVVPLTLNEWVDFPDVYWRIVVAITILAAVGTALVPLMNALFAPKRPRPAPRPVAPTGYAPPPWPTYADGRTPLPVLPDGSPDWNAYYTGHPSVAPAEQHPQPQHPQPQHPEAAPHAPAQPAAPQPHPGPGYQGYPPPPPPPR